MDQPEKQIHLFLALRGRERALSRSRIAALFAFDEALFVRMANTWQANQVSSQGFTYDFWLRELNTGDRLEAWSNDTHLDEKKCIEALRTFYKCPDCEFQLSEDGLSLFLIGTDQDRSITFVCEMVGDRKIVSLVLVDSN